VARKGAPAGLPNIAANIQGRNPAAISVGDTYTDLGAIVFDNQGHDLGYKTFLDGILSGNILIDTSQAATDTIGYVAIDTWGKAKSAGLAEHEPTLHLFPPFDNFELRGNLGAFRQFGHNVIRRHISNNRASR
jgi:hypothetical protein